MAIRWSRYQHLTDDDTIVVCFISLVIAGFFCFVLFTMGFAPGWANGWPGLSQDFVFSAFLTIQFLLISCAFSSALLIWIGYLVEITVRKEYVGWCVFGALMSISLILLLSICPLVFESVYEPVVRE